MKITVKRIARKDTYTIGRLQAGSFRCDTLEDKVRPEGVKVKDKTAIPPGTYRIAMGVRSPKYSNYKKYPWAKPYEGRIPRLQSVPGFEGVLIHPGNTADDTSGCLLVGENKKVGMVINSVSTFHKLMNVLLAKAAKKEDITITIE